MKKLMLLAAMLAMALAAAVPAIAQVGQKSDQEVESGDASQNVTVTGGGDNGNQCAPVQGVGNTGNATNNTGVIQANGDDNDAQVDDSGNLAINPSSSTECKQEVSQAASAASTPKPAPAPAPKPAPAPAPAPKPAPAQAPAPAPAPAPTAKAETPQAKAAAAAPAPAPAPKAEAKAETPQAKAAAAPAPKAEAKAEAPQAKAQAKEAKAQQKQLPKTGGSIASLLTLGVGSALIAGGLLARKLVR